MKKYKKVFIYETKLYHNTKKQQFGVFEDDGSEDGGELIAAFKYHEHAEFFAQSIAEQVVVEY